MNNKVISDLGKSYRRLSKPMARRAFNDGIEVLVMSIDRTPVYSLSSPHVYKKGCSSYMRDCIGKDTIESFEDVMEDFFYFLDTDGYGHVPQRYEAKNYMFSYWIKDDTSYLGKKLPSSIKYDLQGYRGFDITELELGFKKYDKQFVGHYSNDKAGFALYVEVGVTKENVVEMLYKDLVKDGYIK